MPTRLEIIHAYRKLYRNLLRGVSYAMPARFIVRDQLRLAFREPAGQGTAAAAPNRITATAAATTQAATQNSAEATNATSAAAPASTSTPAPAAQTLEPAGEAEENIDVPGWDAEAIRRTIWFLQAASRERGMEHKVLKNLVRMHSERMATTRTWRRAAVWNKKSEDEKQRHEHAYQHYDATLAMLNKSMHICLR